MYDKYLFEAAKAGDLELITQLLEKGVDINVKDGRGKTVLHYAAGNGNLELVQWLIEHGADVNAKDDKGKSAMHYAADNNNWEVVQWLIEHGSEILRHDLYNFWYLANQNGNKNFAQWLFQNKFTIEMKLLVLTSSEYPFT